MRNLYERLKPEVKKAWLKEMEQFPHVLEGYIKELKEHYYLGAISVDLYMTLIAYGTDQKEYRSTFSNIILFDED